MTPTPRRPIRTDHDAKKSKSKSKSKSNEITESHAAEQYRSLVKSGIGALVDCCACRLIKSDDVSCRACWERFRIEKAMELVDLEREQPLPGLPRRKT